MATQTTRPMARPDLAPAGAALKAGRKVLPAYSHVNSPKVFTQPQADERLLKREGATASWTKRLTLRAAAD